MTNKEPSPGPYKSTTTKVIKITPIEFTVTTTIDSTHVPPPDCGCGGGGLSETLMSYLTQYAEQLKPSPTAAPDPFPQGSPTS